MATRMPRFLVAGGLALGSGAALALCLPSIGQIVVQLIAFALDRTVGETWMPTSRRWFTDGILAGAAIAGTGLLLQRPERIAHLTATSRRRVSIAIAVTIAIQGLSIWFRRSAVVGGRRVWFLEDDPMISM